MARPRSRPGGRPHVVCVRLSDEELARLDAHRGSVDRGAWFRWLMKAHSKAQTPGSQVRQALRDTPEDT